MKLHIRHPLHIDHPLPCFTQTFLHRVGKECIKCHPTVPSSAIQVLVHNTIAVDYFVWQLFRSLATSMYYTNTYFAVEIFMGIREKNSPHH